MQPQKFDGIAPAPGIRDLDPPFTLVKTCRKCRRTKPLISFYVDKSRSDGISQYCICCRREGKGVFTRMLAKAQMRREAADFERQLGQYAAERKATWERIRNPINEEWHARKAAVEEERTTRRRAHRAERESEDRKANPEKHKAKNDRWRERNPERVSKYARTYAAANPEKMREKNQRYRDSKADCPLFNLAHRVRSTTRAAFKRKKLQKTNGTIEMLGCTWQHLRAHIQKQFTRGMSWDNMSLWHIDHIVPLASALDETELMRLAHFSNLRPMWAAENMAKGDSIITCQPELTLKMG